MLERDRNKLDKFFDKVTVNCQIHVVFEFVTIYLVNNLFFVKYRYATNVLFNFDKSYRK